MVNKSHVHFQNKVEIGGKNNNCCYCLSTYQEPGIVLGSLKYYFHKIVDILKITLRLRNMKLKMIKKLLPSSQLSQ